MIKCSKRTYRELGDLYMSVEFGETSDLRLSFQVNILDQFIKKADIPGIIETIPTVRSLGIFFNPLELPREYLLELLEKIKVEEKVLNETKIKSRLIKIPVWFNDPWSEKCAQEFGVENNLEFIAKLNGVSISEVVQIYTSTRYWVAGMGFLLGTFAGLPLDPPKSTLNVPKWTVPRKWTYERSVAIAGDAMAVYSIRTPGGYQLVGRTPIDIYDPKQRNPIFKKDPILVKPTDRIEFYSISKAEYYSIRREVEAGSYHYEVEEGTYKLSDYKGNPF